MSAKRELYREGTPENIKKGYTELVYGGENIEVDKGVISGQSGGSGGGGELFLITVTEGDLDKNFSEIKNAIEGGAVIAVYSENENGYSYCGIGYLTYNDQDPDFAYSVTVGNDFFASATDSGTLTKIIW